MDHPYFQQWAAAPAPLPTAAAWPTGMAQMWFPYAGMPFDPNWLQQQPQPNLTDLQPLQPPPTTLQTVPGVEDPVLTPLSPSSSSASDSSDNTYTTLPVGMPPLNLYDQPVQALLTPPSGDDDSSCSGPRSPDQQQWCEATPTGRPPAAAAASAAEGAEPAAATPSQEDAVKEDEKEEKKQSKRGQKRKRMTDEEEASALSLDPTASVQHSYPVVFWRVVGRLAVVGSRKTYNVNSDEIYRRTSMPECLNRSHLGPLLRRGKVRGCGDDLQKLLEARGLSSNKMINRKRFPFTTLSAFLEEEAVQFSADHRELAFSHFPLEPIARLIIRGLATPTELGAAAAEVKIARGSMTSLLAVLEEWTDGGWTSGTARILSSPLASFALATHGLGVEEVRLFASLFSRFLLLLDHECDLHLARVHAALANDVQAMMNNQFPADIDLPEIPSGYLHKPDIEEDAQGSASFAEIPGRLTLQNKKYNVTVAEILRRVRAPESLNLSILGSQLRKGKTANNGHTLRDELSKYGINVDQGRRKLARITLFTCILEGEALAVAADVAEAATEKFPFGQMAEALVARADASHPQTIHTARAGFAAASRIATSLKEAILSMRLPVAERIPHNVAPNAYLMLSYCNLTHGYGPDAAASWIGHISNLFDIAAATLPMV